ncbi:CoA ester lyase [Streptomyces sp. B1866]|uniref:HpcH/HpaI aldolase/citrate lyase family protein n=1 Tax=Streptomyces sp. B1866 TaxID=3075431 RepID=UPI00288D6A2E|nr:CoA ester lyase [Streptomyces sp. B1866]MDT3399252.1 CoA ester lyase [Streptomyces sp. B1866]
MRYSRYCRSLLSTPATEVHRYTSSHQSGADIAMVDLEDSIPPHRKEEARRRATAFFSVSPHSSAPVPPSAESRVVPVAEGAHAPSPAVSRTAPLRAVRINAVGEPDGLRDLLALRDYPVKPDLVLIPKAESPRDVELAAQVLGAACPRTEFFAVIETPRGLRNAAAVAAVAAPLRALVFGSADYAFAVGARLSWDALAYARAALVADARAAGVEVMDAPLFEVFDEAALRREAGRARDLGFSGKIAIHPGQVPVINETFSPDARQLDHARRVVAAGPGSGRGTAVVDGVMVGPPSFAASQRLIEEYGPRPAAAERKGTQAAQPDQARPDRAQPDQREERAHGRQAAGKDEER